MRERVRRLGATDHGYGWQKKTVQTLAQLQTGVDLADDHVTIAARGFRLEIKIRRDICAELLNRVGRIDRKIEINRVYIRIVREGVTR